MLPCNQRLKTQKTKTTTILQKRVQITTRALSTATTELEVEAQRQACNRFWRTTDETATSEDYKLHSESEDWRRRAVEADGEVLKAVKCEETRVFKHMPELMKTRHPGRAQATVNPTMLEAAMQPALKERLITQRDVDHLVSLARNGISIEEFRDFEGPSLNLLEGNADEPEDEDTLCAFYMQQRAQGRCFILDPKLQHELDKMGELVLSASFLVKVPGKKPRAVLNLSSTDEGVNQRMVDLLEANSQGYATISDVCATVVCAFIVMVLNPEKHGISDMHQITMAMLVADADCAFTRVGVASEATGIQAARIKGYTIIPLCCTFGWRRSAEAFSHITAGIKASHASNLDEASFIANSGRDEAAAAEPSTVHRPLLAALLRNKMPNFPKFGSAHVDDFAAVSTLQKGRSGASAKDLLGAIKTYLGQDAIGVKRFKESTFWAQIQKVIGAYFDVDTLTVIMPRPKILEVMAMLELSAFDSS